MVKEYCLICFCNALIEFKPTDINNAIIVDIGTDINANNNVLSKQYLNLLYLTTYEKFPIPAVTIPSAPSTLKASIVVLING